MKPVFELARFADGRLMLRVRFYRTSNFWINDQDEATWVPTFEEVDFLKETLNVANEYNLKNKKDRKDVSSN